MSFEGFLLFAVAAGSAIWLLWSAGRLNAAWLAAQKRKQELDRKRVDMAMHLMKRGEALMQLKGDDAGAAERVAALRALCAQKQKELAGFVPPPPPEIIVTSEYPASREDKAWVVLMAPAGASRPPNDGNPSDAPKKQYLVWAGDTNAAVSRARNVITDEPGYEVHSVQRYT